MSGAVMGKKMLVVAEKVIDRLLPERKEKGNV